MGDEMKTGCEECDRNEKMNSLLLFSVDSEFTFNLILIALLLT